MTENDRFSTWFLCAPLAIIALCATVDLTASHCLRHQSPLQPYYPRHSPAATRPHDHGSPFPQGWPDPYFWPSSRPHHRSPGPLLGPHGSPHPHRGRFDPSYPAHEYYESHYPHYPFGPHDSLDFYRPLPARPYYDVRPQNPFFRPDPYGWQRPQDPSYYPSRPSAVKTLRLNEGDFCLKGHGLYPDYICTNAKNCSGPLAKSFINDNDLDVCSFDGTEPIVCCPTSNGKTPISPRPEKPNGKKVLAKPPARFVRPSVKETATVSDVKVKDVDQISSTTLNDLIKDFDEETVIGQGYNAPDSVNNVAEPPTATEIAQNPDALSTSEHIPVDDTKKRKEGTMTPIVVIQSISDDTLSESATKKAAKNSDSDEFSADDNISTDTLDVTQPSTGVSATDSDTDDQNIEKIFNEKTPDVLRPPIEGTKIDQVSNTILLPLDQPVNVIEPSIEETAVTSDGAADGPVDSSQNLSTAIEKCRQYTAVDYLKNVNAQDQIAAGAGPAHSHDYPHMAIIGYGKTAKDKNEWKCGGSLISERWILTAAHCYRIGSLAHWVRLGVEYNAGILDVRSSAENDDRTKDYQIIQHVLHPNYKKSERYNDIALFYLEKDVEFSAYLRPICLNSDPTLNPSKPVSVSWGRTSTGERQSDVLLVTTLDVIPKNKCKQSYSSISDPKVRFGIQSDSMICASSRSDDGDTCSGVSGGPFQEENAKNPDSYTLFGVTSFCGTQDYPGVYTRVSKYIRWIEEVVWSNN